MKKRKKLKHLPKSNLQLHWLWLIPTLFILTFLLYAYFNTGMFNPNKIDQADLNKWQYEDGLIKGAKEFQIEGSKETCWLLIHGYSSTPKDFNEISQKINDEFNDFVKVPRLKGHGEVPSKLLGLTINDWYSQVEIEFTKLEEECNKINVIGFSMGGVLSLKLAENQKINNLYLISPYLRLRYKLWNILSKEMYLNFLADIFKFKIKNNLAQINSPEGIKEHISYISVPLQPIKNSFPMIDEIILNLDKIEIPTLIQHSKNDDTIDVKSAITTIEKISSTNKKIIVFTKSNHVLPRDFDKREILNNILDFEHKTRL